MSNSGKNTTIGIILREKIRKVNLEIREGRPSEEQIADEIACPVLLKSGEIQIMNVYNIIRRRGGMATGTAENGVKVSRLTDKSRWEQRV